MRKLLIVLLFPLIVACQTTPLRTTQNVAYVCASAAALLNTATAINARLSDTNRARITRAVGVINPICSQETPPTLDSTAHAALSAALGELTASVQ